MTKPRIDSDTHLSLWVTKFDSVRCSPRTNSLIGEGIFAKVYRGELLEKKDEDKVVWANQPVTVSISKFQMEMTEFSQELMKELRILAGLDFPALSLPIAYGLSPDNEYWIVNNLFHTNLQKVFENAGSGETLTNWDETRKSIVIFGIAVGMVYLHRHRIVHYDLNPTNILLDDHFQPYICGFRLSKDIPPDDFVEFGDPKLEVPFTFPLNAFLTAITLSRRTFTRGHSFIINLSLENHLSLSVVD
jgi:serine/threonine protein kinase